MNARTSEAPVLFLHGGPGLNAQMERRRFQTSLAIHWWDQPRISGMAGHAYDSWVGNAEREVRRMSEARGGRVALLASSCGARIAVELLTRVPHLIGAVTISGGVLDVRAAFIRFGRRLAQKRCDQRLRHAVEAAEDKPGRDTCWVLINALLATPHVLDDYWSPQAVEQCATMNRLAAEGSLLDFETFQAVVDDWVVEAAPNQLADPAQRTRVLIGRHDPYAQSGDVDDWHRIFPAATVELVEAGHFPHLELPPERWLPV